MTPFSVGVVPPVNVSVPLELPANRMPGMPLVAPSTGAERVTLEPAVKPTEPELTMVTPLPETVAPAVTEMSPFTM